MGMAKKTTSGTPKRVSPNSTRLSALKEMGGGSTVVPVPVALEGRAALARLYRAQVDRQKCPGDSFVYVGRIYDESNGEDLKRRNGIAIPKELLKTVDTTYQQARITAAGGGSDARSVMKPQDVPAGFHLTPGGSESGNKGWAVSEPHLEGGNESKAMSIYMYCTRGSGFLDAFGGGCNVDVDVCAKTKVAPHAP
jgi:hypothetical protein